MSGVPERVTLGVARKIVNAMIRFAIDNRILPGSYAVVDEGGHVVAFERRDPAPPATSDIAIDKAWTAATMRASGRILEVITRGQPWRLNVKYGGRLTIIPGSIPIIAHGRVIGGIGHSGGSAEDDLRIAQAGWAAIYREEEFHAEVEEGLSRARRLAEAAIKAVAELGLGPVSIAVVDEWGWPLLLYRMDGAPYGTLEVARGKAWTAAAFKAPSEEATSYYAGNPLPMGWNERLTPIPGGLPFPGGALGIAGNSPQDDRKVAEAALEKLVLVE